MSKMVKNTGLPRSLWRFYLSYGVRGCGKCNPVDLFRNKAISSALF